MIYLDHNATTPVLPGPAGDSSFIIHHSSFSEEWGNPSRAFKFGSKLRGVIEAACARSTPVRGVSRTRERVAPGAARRTNAAIHTALTCLREIDIIA